MDTVLIADDEENTRLLIREHLKPEGFNILEARDGAEAQEMIAQHGSGVSAVILDWKMPKLDGIDVLKWIKSHAAYARIPVIMHTGMADARDIHAAIEVGAFYFLMKSAQHDLLVSIVRTAVSDFNYKRSLLQRIEQEGNPYRLLVEGTFRFRTPEEGEYLAMRISKACALPEAAIGLSELLSNAVEHGNLMITYDEKSELVTRGSLGEAIRERLSLPDHARKFVELRFRRGEGHATMRIKDHGTGFDFKKYLVFDESRAFDNHGRGIAIARTLLGVEYIGDGSEVLVTLPSAGA